MVDEKTEYTTFTTEEIVTETKTYETKVEQTSMSLAEEEVSVNQKSGHIETEYDVNGNQKNVTISAVEKKLIRKLDFIYVMPFVAILNFLQFFDKSALGYAAVLGIKDDNGLTGTQYSWVSSIFYLGYLLFQGPSTILIQRLPLSKYVGAVIILWGVVLILTFLSHSFSQLAALRFLLGFFEAGIYPCCIMLISSLYRRNEQAGRIGIVYICNGIAMAVGGLVGYGIGHMDGLHGMRAWKWIMIILGSVTTVFGVTVFFFMVDKPKAKVLKLTPEEEEVVEARMADNAVVQTKKINWNHMLESLKEPRFYCFIFASMFINFQNSALNNFSSLITAGFGFTSLNAILLTIPSGVTDVLYIVFAIWFNRRYGHTLYSACAFFLIAIIGLLLLVVIPVAKAKLLGLYMVWAYAAGFVLLLASIANNVSGYTKKIFYSSMMMVFYTFGNFIGPFLMIDSQKPLYVGGMVACMVFNAATIVLLLLARWLMARENRKRLANPVELEVVPDMTDVENKNFIYRL